MTTKLVRCSLCACKEYHQSQYGDYYCYECERDLGELTDRMFATERVLEAAFEWRKDFHEGEYHLRKAVEAHPDFKEEK